MSGAADALAPATRQWLAQEFRALDPHEAAHSLVELAFPVGESARRQDSPGARDLVEPLL